MTTDGREREGGDPRLRILEDCRGPSEPVGLGTSWSLCLQIPMGQVGI